MARCPIVWTGESRRSVSFVELGESVDAWAAVASYDTEARVVRAEPMVVCGQQFGDVDRVGTHFGYCVTPVGS